MRADGGRTPFGIDLGIGAVVMVAATVAAAVLFPPAGVTARLVVVAVAAGGYAAMAADPLASLVTAGLGLLLCNGFLVNRYGELTWDGTTSLWYFTAFVLVSGLGLGWRWIRRVRADLALAEEFNEIVENTETSKEGVARWLT